MQVDEGHSRTPPITNALFSESCMQGVQGDRELLRSVLFALLIKRPVIEQHALLGEAGETGHAQRHGSQSNPPTHALVKEGPHHGRQITFPARFWSDTLVFGYIEVIARADREGETAADTTLTPERPAEPLQRVQQSAG